MPEKTYTLTELITNLRKAETDGVFAKYRCDANDAASGLIVAMGYPITEEGYAQFDADLTAVGL